MVRFQSTKPLQHSTVAHRRVLMLTCDANALRTTHTKSVTLIFFEIPYFGPVHLKLSGWLISVQCFLSLRQISGSQSQSLITAHAMPLPRASSDDHGATET